MLHLSHISKRFGPHIALDDVSFDVRGGEVHALLGENGAGKTTLMRIAYGLTVPDSGEIVASRGHAVVTRARLDSPMAARALGIGMVHQHFTSIAALTVAENVALAAGWRGGRDHVARAAQVIERLGLPLEPTALVRTLSVQLRQRLEIVQALASDARILLLDEPTAMLAPREVDELLHLVRGFRDQGGAVVLISHKLAEVAQVADRVTVLRRGRVTLSGAARDHDAAALSRAMIGAGADVSGQTAPIAGRRPFTIHHLPVPRVELEGIVLHAGELIGVAAIEGNGQRELLRGIAGVIQATTPMTVHGSVAFVPEDRGEEALLPALSLTANYLLGQLHQAPHLLNWPQMEGETAALLQSYDVRGGTSDTMASMLSGGNQQKFILGRALERHTDVLVLENPTRGLDVLATAAMHQALRRAADNGVCVVVHASDIDEVLALADRVLVVCIGVVREMPADTPRDRVGDAMLGLS